MRLTLGAVPAATYRYAVIPNLDNAKFLLPLVSRRVTAASLLAYNALRPTKVRLSRAALGSLARAGALGLTRAPVRSGEVPAGTSVLWDRLAEPLGAARLHAAIGVRPPDPHHKPTLQLFDDDGRPRGYAKMGWNDGTRAMVRAEVSALTGLPPAGGDLPDVPRMLLHTRWQDREVAVIEPMPEAVRRIPRPRLPRIAAILAVARRGGPPAPRQTPEALFESWHRRGAGGVPVGFDLAHQAFQTALSIRGWPAARCAAAVDAALRAHGPALGLDTAARQRFVADAYLIELWLRTYELSQGGAGWNPRLHPALLRVLSGRLLQGSSDHCWQ